MLIIRREQFDAFRQDDWQRFLRTIAAEARTVLASRGDPRATEPLESAVGDAVRLAQRHGFRTRPHLLRFARLVLVSGPGWETPVARAILSDETLTTDARLERLEAGAND